ncbi:alternative ribosome rescue aminoacyl-tRNA hydrolase ArfB [uncultured Fluviicola sp.]|uniref:alternative ribosome rescue aminoacyl-tRNA hydrolase ArfB n=1 Tax=uncultured Fluviicola sp. TaxID=463303 RepID=UPI0025EAF59C|nr:alternative ribosome rescue aminoacyl-tRNA hydrolase ArfB [uncultured Fluviicola sp.]
MGLSAHQVLSEISFRTSRSGGKGGQNVNKVSSKVELNWNIQASTLITDEQREILLNKLSHKITKDGVLQIISQTHRTQLGNKQLVLEKLDELLESAFKVVKKRKQTKVPKGVKERRLLVKKKKAEIKKLRGKVE